MNDRFTLIRSPAGFDLFYKKGKGLEIFVCHWPHRPSLDEVQGKINTYANDIKYADSINSQLKWPKGDETMIVDFDFVWPDGSTSSASVDIPEKYVSVFKSSTPSVTPTVNFNVNRYCGSCGRGVSEFKSGLATKELANFIDKSDQDLEEE